MKKLLLILAIAATVTSCKSKSSTAGKEDKGTTETVTKTNSADGIVNIDIASLKDENAYLQAWEKFTDARMEDERKQKEDKSYAGHYTEYIDMYTAMLKATTAFQATLPDASARVAFSEKVSAIQNKMYAK